MQLDLVQEVWQELRRFVNNIDRSDAAESLVAVLVENGIEPADIQTEFDDQDIRRALRMYLDDQDIEQDDDDYQELNFDDE